MGINLKLMLILLFLVGCKTSKQLTTSKITEERKDKNEYVITDLTKIDKLIKDLVINTDKKIDFVMYDTSKPIVEGKPPVLMEASLVDNTVITDKSTQEELITDNSEVLIKDKGKVNIRDELTVKERKNNKSWIEQLTRFGVVIILLLVVGIYIKKRWF